MALRFLIDENLLGRLLRAIARHNARGVNLIDALQVGEILDLPRASEDPEILLWAERENQILVSFDLSTVPLFLGEHLQAGHHSPGVFLIRRGSSYREVIEFLALAAHASDPWEWQDRCHFIPL
jgi:predicted nuclease of predicted toxin-antitoxin system